MRPIKPTVATSSAVMPPTIGRGRADAVSVCVHLRSGVSDAREYGIMGPAATRREVKKDTDDEHLPPSPRHPSLATQSYRRRRGLRKAASAISGRLARPRPRQGEALIEGKSPRDSRRPSPRSGSAILHARGSLWRVFVGFLGHSSATMPHWSHCAWLGAHDVQTRAAALIMAGGAEGDGGCGEFFDNPPIPRTKRLTWGAHVGKIDVG